MTSRGESWDAFISPRVANTIACAGIMEINDQINLSEVERENSLIQQFGAIGDTVTFVD